MLRHAARERPIPRASHPWRSDALLMRQGASRRVQLVLPGSSAGAWHVSLHFSAFRQQGAEAFGSTAKGKTIWLLRQRWGIATVTINGVSANPLRWPDGSYSVQGAAAALKITPQTVFDHLARGWLSGRQLAKGQPWQIELSDAQIIALRARVPHTRRSRKEAP